MSMETLEFVIYPDGRVEEKVTGISGRNCTEVTAAIEAQLGRVVETQTTAEFFAEADVALTAQSQTQNYQTQH
jgi:hypothetical protein